MSQYKELDVWKKSKQLCLDVYNATKSFPREELYSLTDQIKRCSVSIPSNIAEGNGRGSTKDYIRFLNIARGSLFELDTQLEIAKDLDFLDEEKYCEFQKSIDDIRKMLNRLINVMEDKIR